MRPWRTMTRKIMQQIFSPRVAATAAMIMTLFLTGCLEIDQTLRLNRDGSGTVRFVYAVSEEQVERIQAVYDVMYAEPGDETAFDPSEETIRRDFKRYEPYGVKLRSVRTETRNGWRYRTLNITFKSLNGLSKTDFLADRKVSLVKNAQGNYVFTQSGSHSEDTVGTRDRFLKLPTDPISAKLMAGFRAVLRVQTPGKILRTNAPKRKEHTATWVFDINEDSEVLEKMQTATMTIVFDGEGLRIPEFRSVDALKR